MRIGLTTATSAEWQRRLPYVQIVDPDGWDRLDGTFDHAWTSQEITEAEYRQRRANSTCRLLLPVCGIVERNL
jgi:hypothetical protein